MSINIYDKNTGELTRVAGNSKDSNIAFPAVSTGKFLKDDNTWDDVPNIVFPATPEGKFLKDDNTWDDVPPNPTITIGATATTDGESGLVPKPSAGDQDKVLKGDGTWGDILSLLNIIAPIETSPSKSGYETNDYLIFNNSLWKVIYAIPSGSSLIEGTNIEKTTIMKEVQNAAIGSDDIVIPQ